MGKGILKMPNVPKSELSKEDLDGLRLIAFNKFKNEVFLYFATDLTKKSTAEKYKIYFTESLRYRKRSGKIQTF